MLTFYHAPQSRSIRTLWLFEELAVPYDLRYVDIVYGDGRPGQRDPANPHPDGKVPVIEHDGVRISESYAIALYLTDLVPGNGLGAQIGSPERGPFLEWLAWSATELEPVISARMFGGGTDQRSQRVYDDAMRRVEDALAAGPYLMGDRFTAIDVMVGGSLAWARSVLPQSAALDAYLERISTRPAGATAFAKDAPVLVAA